MRKYISVGIGILAIVIVVKSFLGGQTVGDIFGIEMNIWIYRGIWFLFGAHSFYRFYEENKSEVKE